MQYFQDMQYMQYPSTHLAPCALVLHTRTAVRMVEVTGILKSQRRSEREVCIHDPRVKAGSFRRKLPCKQKEAYMAPVQVGVRDAVKSNMHAWSGRLILLL